ncbi:hypothetical protein AcW1_000953 [Taiwanofungus camphoratus]|nr:hypothetical protein AcW1_000953 [Antrodia cinnamomea]
MARGTGEELPPHRPSSWWLGQLSSHGHSVGPSLLELNLVIASSIHVLLVGGRTQRSVLNESERCMQPDVICGLRPRRLKNCTPASVVPALLKRRQLRTTASFTLDGRLGQLSGLPISTLPFLQLF